MSQLTASELSLVRSRPQRTKLSLSVFRPTTVMKCRVNDGSIARNAITIAYDTVTLGSYTAVEAGMTLLVGTTEGGKELGKIRIRSVDGSEFTVAENSYIEWADGLYLTVIRFWDIWPVYPRIISDPSNPENTLWYKDYDVAYTTQNTVLGALPCAGPHRAAYLDGGNATIYYTASGTSHVADVGFSTHWFFEGATVTGSNDYSPGNITYDTPGHYATRLVVSGSNGTVDTTYRYVSIYDRPENGTNVPILKWEISSIQGSRSGGGYTMSVKVLENIDIDEGDVVVLFGESWFGNNKQTIGGNAPGNSSIFFVGYILKGSIRYNYKIGEVTFEIGNITQYMKDQEGFSVSVASVASPSYWYELYDMDIQKAIYHYWKWHSTVLSTNDVQFLGLDRPIQFFDSDRASIYDAVDNLVRGTLLGGVTSDMQGKIWAEAGAQAFPEVTGTYTNPIMELQKGDWVETPRIDEQFMPKTSYIEYGGIAFSGVSTGTFTPLMSEAPGNAPLYRGKAERKQGLALKSQVELNQITGHVLANNNHHYPSLDYQLVGAFRNLDIAPQEKVALLVNATDTPRGILISGAYMPDSINWIYDSRTQMFHPDRVSFVPLVTGSAGQTVDIPPAPEDTGTGFSQPSIRLPAVPSIYTPTIVSSSPAIGHIVLDMYESTIADWFGNAGNATVNRIIRSSNSPITLPFGITTSTIFRFTRPGWHSMSYSFGVRNLAGVPDADDFLHVMCFDNSYNTAFIFGSTIPELGDISYGWCNISAEFYVYPDLASATDDDYSWIHYPYVGRNYYFAHYVNPNGPSDDWRIYNALYYIARLGD